MCPLIIKTQPIGLRTAQHIEQDATPKRIIKTTAVQDILEVHHIVNVSGFSNEYALNTLFLTSMLLACRWVSISALENAKILQPTCTLHWCHYN